MLKPKKIINIGVTEDQSLEDSYRIRYVNQMNLIGLIGCLFFIVSDYSMGLYGPSLVMTVMTLAIFGSFYLMKLGHTNMSPILSISSCALAGVIISYQIKADISLEYIFFVLAPLPNIAIKKELSKLTNIFMITLLTLGAIIVISDFDKLGGYELNISQARFLKVAVYLQAGILMIFQVLVTNREIKNRYNQYLENYSKIENQARLSDLGRLFAGIAHEINNPLAIIKGSSSYCLKRFKKSVISQERLEIELIRINKQIERVVQIIQGLKHISRDGSNDNYTETSINKILEQTITLCSFIFKDNAISYNIQYLDTDAKLLVNPVQIEQVFYTLISNAIDALDKQENKEINIHIKQDSSHVTVKFSDNGPGVPEGIQKDIFKPFFTTKPLGKGTGLGLSVAFEVIQNHKGILRVENNPDGGACFFVTLAKQR